MEAKLQHALPKFCHLSSEDGLLFLMRQRMLPELKKTMSGDEIIAASEGQQPELDRMRQITCRGCAMERCPLNFHYRPSGGLTDLMNGRTEERVAKGNELLEQLLPAKKRRELERRGISAIASQMPSRKNAQLYFSFSREEETRRVTCQIGKGTLRTTEGEERLMSLDQVRQRIEEACAAFA